MSTIQKIILLVVTVIWMVLSFTGGAWLARELIFNDVWSQAYEIVLLMIIAGYCSINFWVFKELVCFYEGFYDGK